jgi:hypothetical protein
MTDQPPEGCFSGLRIGFSTANGSEPLATLRISTRLNGVSPKAWVRRTYGLSDRTQLEIFSRTAGAIVSSIVAYSVGEPVVAVWNRWFTPGISST